jgi:erythromycin esterase-like protein
MAEYLLWLTNEWFANEKIIVWTTNGNALRQLEAPMMGSILSSCLGEKLVSIGFTASRGRYHDFNCGELVEIQHPDETSLEALLSGKSNDSCFIDLRQSGTLSALGSVANWRFMQYRSVNTTLAESFDLIIHSNVVSPSQIQNAIVENNGASNKPCSKAA